MFEHWIKDQEDHMEAIKNHAYLIGSFINPEAVQQMRKEKENTVEMSEDQLDKVSELLSKYDNKKEEPIKRRRKRKIGK